MILVRRRIDEMAGDVEVFLSEFLVSNEFSLLVDESTLRGNKTLQLTYVRFVKERKIIEKMLFAKTLVTDTKGKSIFNTVKNYFN